MPNNYSLNRTPRFNRIYKKLSKSNLRNREAVRRTLKKLANDPFQQSLHTHKVIARNYGESYASRITGDLRIIWIFEDDNHSIILLTIGGHSGKGKVYM